MPKRHVEPKPTKIYDEIVDANQSYAATFGDKANLALPPARGFAILTCMDARLDPAKYAGLAEGDAHVIRNAGGRASDDAIRSLVISHKLLGTKEWFVIHHTDCGMQLFDSATMASLLETSRATATFDGAAWANTQAEGGSSDGWHVAWLTFKNLEQSVRDDVLRIRNHPLTPKDVPVWGFIYDVKSGQLLPVESVRSAGLGRYNFAETSQALPCIMTPCPSK